MPTKNANSFRILTLRWVRPQINSEMTSFPIWRLYHLLPDQCDLAPKQENGVLNGTLITGLVLNNTPILIKTNLEVTWHGNRLTSTNWQWCCPQLSRTLASSRPKILGPQSRSSRLLKLMLHECLVRLASLPPRNSSML